jgi:hypothetical protein
MATRRPLTASELERSDLSAIWKRAKALKLGRDGERAVAAFAAESLCAVQKAGRVPRFSFSFSGTAILNPIR